MTMKISDIGRGRLCTVGYSEYKDAPDELLQLLQDNNAYIATEAAYAVLYLGEKEKGIKTSIPMGRGAKWDILF